MDPENEVKVETKDKKKIFKTPFSDVRAARDWLRSKGLSGGGIIGGLGNVADYIEGKPAPMEAPSEYRFGTLPYLVEQLPQIGAATPRALIDTGEDFLRWATGAQSLPQPSERLSSYLFPRVGQSADIMGELQGDRTASSALRGRAQGMRQEAMAAEQPEEVAPTNWLAEALAYQQQFTPNYADIMARYSDEGQATNAAIQALYNRLAEGAQQNVQQLQDIYGGAESATGQAYDIGTGNIGEAYSSAQQQAADQLARLGIEAAAPQVINPMALSQAETQSALESGRASALGGIASRGATAQDFASQMAQAAQMQGAEYQTSVADALRRQLIGLELQAQQDAYQRALQAPGLAQDLYAASQLGQPQGLTFDEQLALQQQAFREEQALQDASFTRQQAINDTYNTLRTREGGNLTHEEALAEIELRKAAGVL